MKLKTITENKHKELLSLLNPLVDFMIENEYNYFIVVGKDGVCTRHMRGQSEDVGGMLGGMSKKDNQVGMMLKDVVSNLKTAKAKK